MKYTVFIVLITVFGLVGCAATVKPMTTPTGRQGFHVECGGSAYDWSKCYDAATKACNGPYSIVDRVGGSTATAYGPLVDRELIVECRN